MAAAVDQYPTLVELADHLTEDDQEIQFGIDMCLRGLDALAPKRGG